MRKVDQKFTYLRPEKELYQAKTYRHSGLRYRCVFGDVVERNEPMRVIFFREVGWKWKGQEALVICAKHYKEITGEEI